MRIAAALAFAFALTAAAPAIAEDTMIPAAEVQNHVNETGTVVGVLSGVHKARSGKVLYLNIGGTYPDNPFTGVIFIGRMSNVPDFTPVIGKTIAVTGKIEMYRGKPQIVINTSDQVKIAR